MAFYIPEEKVGTIEIVNPLGGIVSKYEVDGKSNKIVIRKENLMVGFYTFRLIVDGTIIKTNKMIVN